MEEGRGKGRKLEKEATEFEVPTSAEFATDVAKLVESIKDVALNISQASAVIGCFLAADTTDKKALLLQGELGDFNARFSTALLKIQQVLANIEEVV